MITQLDKHPKENQKEIFLHVIGVTGLKLYNSIVFTAFEDEDGVKLIIIIGQGNVIYESYWFNNWKQNDDETIDSYVGDLRKLAKNIPVLWMPALQPYSRPSCHRNSG